MKQTMVQTRVCLVLGSFSNTLQRRTSKRRVRETTALMLLVGISSCKAKMRKCFLHFLSHLEKKRKSFYKNSIDIFFITFKLIEN